MHLKIANDIIDCLYKSFPTASIALFGSVANNTYTENSDIDILVVKKDINESYNISFKHCNTRISIFILNEVLLRKNETRYLYSYNNLPYATIITAKIIYDPNSLILDLKEKASTILLRKLVIKAKLMEGLKMKIEQLLTIETVSYVEMKNVFYQIISLVLSLFFLKEFPEMVHNKKTKKKIFSYIKERDGNLYNIVMSCIPHHKESLELIKNGFFSYIQKAYS